MRRDLQGKYVIQSTVEEKVNAFIPSPSSAKTSGTVVPFITRKI